MTVPYKVAWLLGRHTLGKLSYKKFYYGVKLLNSENSGIYSKFRSGRTRLFCAACYAIDSCLRKAGIDRSLYQDFLRKHLKNFTFGQIAQVPKILHKYKEVKKLKGKEAAMAIPGMEVVRRKLRELRLFFEDNVEKIDYFLVETLQINEGAKKSTFMKTSKFDRWNFISYMIVLTVGTSSPTRAGELKKEFGGHSVFVTGYYRNLQIHVDLI